MNTTSKIRKTKRSLCAALLAVVGAATLGLSGCLVAPVRLRTHAFGAAGAMPSAKFDFAKPGTERDQIAERLQPIATGVESPRFFYGRYSRSGWAVVAGVAAGNNLDVGGARLWHGRNLLVDFDEAGRVIATHDVGDGALAKELAKRALLAGSPDCEQDVEIPITATHFWTKNEEVSLTLRDGEVIVPERRGHPEAERIPLAQLRIKTGGTGPGANPGLTIGVTIRGAKQKDSHLEFRTQAKDLFELVRFAQACGAATRSSVP